MEKLALTADQKKALRYFDTVIKKGDVREILSCLAKMMADGVMPSPRQIAKISAIIYKTENQELITEFGIKYAGLGSFTKKLEEVILENGTAEQNFDFAQYAPGADIIAHGKVIRRKKNKMWWVAFSRMFPEQALIITQGQQKETKKSKAKESTR